MFFRSQPISTPSGESRCVQDERCGDIWLKSTPCTGDQIPGRSRSHICGSFASICLLFCFDVDVFVFSRLLVSASQDGKLIIWDSYTTNKVGLACTFRRIRVSFLYVHHLSGHRPKAEFGIESSIVDRHRTSGHAGQTNRGARHSSRLVCTILISIVVLGVSVAAPNVFE